MKTRGWQLWHRVVDCAVAVTLMVTAHGSYWAATRATWKSSQEVWWSDKSLVRNAIESYLRFMKKHPELERSDDRPTWEIVSLVLVLDAKADTESTATLVDLLSYDIGESGHETLRCVIQRKGARASESLKKAIEASTSPCQQSEGDSGPICLPKETFRSEAKSLLGAIENNSSCYIEK
jgi:hypothetical protein